MHVLLRVTDDFPCFRPFLPPSPFGWSGPKKSPPPKNGVAIFLFPQKVKKVWKLLRYASVSCTFNGPIHGTVMRKKEVQVLRPAGPVTVFLNSTRSWWNVSRSCVRVFWRAGVLRLLHDCSSAAAITRIGARPCLSLCSPNENLSRAPVSTFGAPCCPPGNVFLVFCVQIHIVPARTAYCALNARDARAQRSRRGRRARRRGA
jgi:hypothetical protein